MSRHEESQETRASDGHQQVGYRKPPAAHQFKPGQSGNPKGRPRKTNTSIIPKAQGLGVASQPTNQIVLAEGNRKIAFRENGKAIELSAMQLVIRAAYAAAMRGDRWALRLLMERNHLIESSEREERVENFTTMVKYQADGRYAIAKARAAGLPEPLLVPHPDDIIIDMKTGETAICGPVTPEDRAEWHDVLAWRDSLHDQIRVCAASHDGRDAPGGGDGNLARWHRLQAHYDMVNDNLPPRYRKELVDRSFADGATLPGSQKTRDFAGE